MSKEIREYIDKFRKFALNENVDRTFKNKILTSLKDMLGAYGKLPREIKEQVKFDQIPDDVYEKLNDYYNVEKGLPGDTYIEFSKQKLKSVGKGIDDYFLGFLGFIELIGVDKFDRYNTIELYNGMIDEIRNLPDIKNSDDIIGDYNIFRKTVSGKNSPTRNLALVITSRFQDEYEYYRNLVNKDF